MCDWKDPGRGVGPHLSWGWGEDVHDSHDEGAEVYSSSRSLTATGNLLVRMV